MLYVTACHAGVFALDKTMRIVAFELFPNDASAVRERLHVISKGALVPELEKLLSELTDKNIITDLAVEWKGLEIEHVPNNPGAVHVQNNLRKIAVDVGFVKDANELTAFLADVARLETKTKMRTRTHRDRLVAQAVASIEDLTEIANLMSERLHEWYGLHNPELERKVKDNEKYARAITEDVKRDDESVGMSIAPEDLAAIKLHAAETADIFALKRDHEVYLENTMPSVAPNTTAIAGPILAARLIKNAGGLERLAKLPASTVQLLGAEKALFRFMKTRKAGGKNARPPKYGLLFTHPYVQSAPQEKRGKVARTVAAKISMAAKTDFYSGEDRTEMYLSDMRKKIEEAMRN